MTTFPRLAAAALLAGALIPATASAATDHSSGVLDKDKATFEWDSRLGTGVVAINTIKPKIPCGTAGVHDCDTTLIHVVGAGTLQVTNTSSDPLAIDTDLYLYESDADGTLGPQITYSADSSPTPNEAVGADTGEGDSWFIAEIDYSVNAGGVVHGTATFTPAPPEDPETPDGAEF